MSRLIIITIIAVIGVGAYFYATQPEPTPSEQLQSAAEDAGDAVSEAASAVQEAASAAVDAATQQGADAAAEAQDQVAALAAQGQELLNSWVQDGLLTAQELDYDAMIASVQDSALAQDVKTRVIRILEDIKASPDLAAEKILELRNYLSSQ